MDAKMEIVYFIYIHFTQSIGAIFIEGNHMNNEIVYDIRRRIFRALDVNNYNDDLIVGILFFEREAISVIVKYFRIVGYVMIDEIDNYYPIDIREDDVVIFEGTYNWLPDKLKKELEHYIIQEKPNPMMSRFFYRWQLLGDWNVFDDSGSYIKLAAVVNGNDVLKKKLVDEHIDLVFPINYKELSKLACNLSHLFEVEFYNKGYYEDVNYLFDSLINGYHINMTTDEVYKYCYQLCSYVVDKEDEENA